MRLRDDETGQFVSFDSYIGREGIGVSIEGVAQPKDEAKDEEEFIPSDDGFEPYDYSEYDFDDQDMYP